MKVFLVALVLCCSLAWAQPDISLDENELSQIGDLLDYGLRSLDTSELLELDLTAGELGEDDLQSSDGRRKCGICVRHAAFHIMHAVVEHIKEYCEHTHCPVEKRHCEIMARHKDVVFGYLLEKVQPAKLGFFYCAGAGYCGHGDRDRVMNSTAVLPDPRMDIVVDQPVELEATLVSQGLNYVNVTSLWNLTSFEVEEDAPDTTTVVLSPEEENGRRHRRCFRCVGCASAHIMRHVVEHVVEFCRHTRCPVAKRHCEWAAHHRGIVFGILLAKVEPHKYAFGACVALGRCGHHH